MKKNSHSFTKDPALRFAVTFVMLFALLYLSYLGLLGLTAPGNHYSPFLAHYFNLVHWLRILLLNSTKGLLTLMGYSTIVNEYNLLVAGHNLLLLNYDCLGFGVMCFFSAFVITYPKPLVKKIVFLVCGLVVIQSLNILRLTWLALFWKKTTNPLADHHTIFNITIYILIAIALYFWVKGPNKNTNAAN